MTVTTEEIEKIYRSTYHDKKISEDRLHLEFGESYNGNVLLVYIRKNPYRSYYLKRKLLFHKDGRILEYGKTIGKYNKQIQNETL